MFGNQLVKGLYRHQNISNRVLLLLYRREMNYHERRYSLRNSVFFFPNTKHKRYRYDSIAKDLQIGRPLFTNTHVAFRNKRTSVLFGMNDDELLLHGEDVIQELSTRDDLTDKIIARFRNELSGILYQYFTRTNEQYLVKMFDMISKRKQCNEACHTIMMRYFVQVNNVEKVKQYFNMLQTDPSISLHGRSFVPLINIYLRREEYKMAKVYFAQLLENAHKEFKDTPFQDIILECSTLVNEQNHKELGVFIDSVFGILQKFGSTTLHPQTVSAIQQWFMRDPLERWHIQKCVIDRNGVCDICKKSLHNVTIPEERLSRLKRNLMTLIESSIARKNCSRLTDVKPLKTNINIRNKIQSQAKYFDFFDVVSMQTSKGEFQPSNDVRVSNTANSLDVFDKLKELQQFLDLHGPFDVVIDVLNAGYFTKGFNPLQVCDVVRPFRSKRCLVLCAGILKKELLEQRTVPAANKRIQQLLKYLHKNCHLFFVGSSVVDDYYILYTILHHNFNVEVVSRDLFRDHLFHLHSENTSDFQRWQKTSQYILQTFTTDNEPVFKDRVAYKIAMQESGVEGHWHVPVTQNEWMCIQKKFD